MTIVEGVIACLILAIGSLASLQLFDVATRTTYRAEESQSLVNRLQAELEEVKGLPFGSVAMAALPVDSADQADPRWRVAGSSFAIERNGTSPAPLVVDAATGAVGSSPEAFEIGDVSGQIYKFVVWRDDPGCPASLCPGHQDLKRVIVSARTDPGALGSSRSYHEIQADIADPDATPVDNPAPPGGEGGTVGEFWLTDTPCNHSARQEITADHPTHNTRGACSAGLSTGTTPGAPDLMFTEGPALDPDYPPDGQPLFDYASELEPTVNPNLDKGVFMREQGSNGCLAADLLNLIDLPPAESDRHQKLHKWMSPALPQDFELALIGNGTLELWTKSVNGVNQSGRICVTLFVRKLDGLGQPDDVPVVYTGGGGLISKQFTDSTWPTAWTEISVPLEFIAPPTLLPGERMGLAITVERAGTGNAGLEFMYDHPSFDSRLQLETDRALAF